MFIDTKIIKLWQHLQESGKYVMKLNIETLDYTKIREEMNKEYEAGITLNKPEEPPREAHELNCPIGRAARSKTRSHRGLV
ncbi:MAG TPA: hypothetical protein VLH35_03590 [Candidatus Acidoferrales bacterium]|nr:hypothetical protein [Candidatus Acidoferrales bacterium]